MKRGLFALALLASALVPHGCGWFASDSSDPVAKVAGEKLTTSELDQMLKNGAFEEKSVEARRRAVTRWVNRELLYQEALRKRVDRDPDVRLQIETARRDILVSALVDRLQDDGVSLSDEEIRRYYEENKSVFKRSEAMVHARQIILESASEARRIAAEVARRPDSFEQLARTRSSDPSSADGGDVGFVTLRTAYSPEVWQVLQRLSDNEISRPIAIDAGSVILQAVEHRPAGSVKSLDEVRSEVVNRVRAAKRATLMAALAESLKLKEDVEIFTDRIGPPNKAPQSSVAPGSE
jgi:peptidyl-prolyl cis-trans isomerase C